jgi:hypothetical protein
MDPPGLQRHDPADPFQDVTGFRGKAGLDRMQAAEACAGSNLVMKV